MRCLTYPACGHPLTPLAHCEIPTELAARIAGMFVTFDEVCLWAAWKRGDLTAAEADDALSLLDADND